MDAKSVPLLAVIATTIAVVVWIGLDIALPASWFLWASSQQLIDVAVVVSLVWVGIRLVRDRS